MREASLVKPVNIELPIKQVLQQLSKINTRQNQGLIQKLQTLPIDKVSVQIKPSGESNLLLQNTKPVGSIVITKEMAQALAPLKLPNQQAVIKHLNLSTDINKPIQSPAQASRPELNSNTQKPIAQNTTTTNKTPTVSSVDGRQSPAIRLSMKDAAANLQAVVQDKTSRPKRY